MLRPIKHRIATVAAVVSLSAAFLLALTTARALADVSETILHTFSDGSVSYDGQMTYGGLVQAADGTYYGTTINGGTAGYGTVYKIAPDGTYSILHNFDDGSVANDGLRPYDTLVIGSDGNLYGTTEVGGATSHGAVFKMTPAGAVTILHSFAGGSDGENPLGGVAFGTDGKLYGVTPISDSDTTAAYGTIYSLSTDGSNYLVQFRFNDDNQLTDGAEPNCTLVPVPGSTSNQFYGTSEQGGTGDDDENGGEGTVFKFTPHTTDGGGGFSVIYSFNKDGSGDDGERPYLGALQIDSSGNLYGDTTQGGTNNDGVIYKLTPSGTETLLHTFGTGSDGHGPFNALTFASDGYLYGTTETAGKYNEGTVFKISPTGSGFATIYNFGSSSSDGAGPVAMLVEDSDGNLLGTTSGGGADYGVVYKLATSLPNPVKIGSLTVSPSSVIGGSANATGKVTLKVPAPSAGATITLTSSNTSAASVPSTVKIAANATSATFTVTSHTVTSSTSVTITAAYNSSSTSKTLTVTPAASGPSLKEVDLSPTSTPGGIVTTANRVYFTADATNAAVVSLTSSNTSVATVPSTATFTTGHSSVTFKITTKAVTKSTAVTITATYNGVSKTATLTVVPGLKSVTLSPTSTKGGTSTTANRVYFTGDAAADTVVSLASSNTSVATVNASTTVVAGRSSQTFTIKTKAVTSTKTVTITATSGGLTQTATLTVTP